MSRGSKFKALLYRVSLDEVPELSGLAAEVYACARDLAKPMDVFEEQRAKHLLLRSMRHLMAAARNLNGTSERRKNTMAHKMPAARPELIFDPDTGLYDVCHLGCVTHAGLDVIGEREKIRAAAAARMAANPEAYAGLPTDEPTP